MASSMFKLFIYCIAVTFLAPSDAEVFTSLEQLKGLARLENFLQTLLDKYINTQPVVPMVLKDFSDRLKEQVEARTIEGIETYVSKPTNAFQLMRRFLKHWTELTNYLNQGPNNDLKTILNENRVAFPSTSDALWSASAILRIQDVFNYTATQIANGHVTARDSGTPLDADECYELGYLNHEWQYFEQSRDWMREALRRMGPTYQGVLRGERVLEYLAWAEYQVGDLEDAIKHSEEILRLDPDNNQTMLRIEVFERELLYRERYHDSQLPEKPNIDNRNKKKEPAMLEYERLCRKTDTIAVTSPALVCYYKSTHPLLRLKPAKIEILSREPEVLLLHDVITEKEIAYIKEVATPRLKRAEVIANTSTGLQEFANYRISKSAWIDDNESKTISRVSFRLESVTGLAIRGENSEQLQVSNYGLGGHYEPHHDYIDTDSNSQTEDDLGERAATVLLYLSPVKAGGATVFVESETVIPPKMGSAVFWYNTFKSGKPDERTLHAACPVIIGSKWVANKWILEKGQMFTRQCGLTIDE